jgi:hypothetical protein
MMTTTTAAKTPSRRTFTSGTRQTSAMSCTLGSLDTEMPRGVRKEWGISPSRCCSQLPTDGLVLAAR